jgi:hypothetical protein
MPNTTFNTLSLRGTNAKDNNILNFRTVISTNTEKGETMTKERMVIIVRGLRLWLTSTKAILLYLYATITSCYIYIYIYICDYKILEFIGVT